MFKNALIYIVNRETSPIPNIWFDPMKVFSSRKKADLFLQECQNKEPNGNFSITCFVVE